MGQANVVFRLCNDFLETMVQSLNRNYHVLIEQRRPYTQELLAGQTQTLQVEPQCQLWWCQL